MPNTVLDPDLPLARLARATACPTRSRSPTVAAEGGIATEDDHERLDYLASHLAALAQARAEAVDVRGYLHWSAFDNFEWSEGYRPRFGLVAVDDAFTRLPKPSAHAFARLARTGRLDALHDLHERTPR
ncbi:family 1 glycosylhydrolase [Micromonospora vulcania]|uniref:Family 1 glycosylhydrolase n=1 Tax=Micromonospora vulcania TaxID=1441873 RepID=A0ABW1H1R5_9ACTN